MSELNSQITRLKITYLAKLPLFISLKSLCRYSSKAVSLLMRRTQEMGKQENNAHNVVRIKASDLLSRVPRFPLHSFSQGWCVGEEVGGWHPRCQRKKNIYMGGEASSLAGDFLRKEEGNFYLAPLLLPFFITAEHDRAFLLELRCNSFISLLAFAALLRKVTSNLLLYARSSCYGRLLSILPDIHSGAESEVSICPLPNECQW